MPDFTAFEAPIARRIRGIQARDWFTAMAARAANRIVGLQEADRIVLVSAASGAWLLSVDWNEDAITVTEPGNAEGYRFCGAQNAFLFLDAVVEPHLL